MRTSSTLRNAVTLAVLLLYGCTMASKTWGQSTAPPARASESQAEMLEYVKELNVQSETHRKFLEDTYTRAAQVVGGLVGAVLVIFPALFVWLNWNTRRGIRSQVTQYIKTVVNAEVVAELASMRTTFDQFQQETEAASKRTTAIQEAFAQGFAVVTQLTMFRLSPLVDPKSKELKDKMDSLALTVKYKVKAALGDNPESRRLGILLARLHRWHNDDWWAGISVLTAVLSARRKASLQLDDDDADLLYNRACYKNQYALTLLNQAAGGSQTEDAHRNQLEAVEDLKQSFNITPANQDSAKTDKDLAGLNIP